MTLPFITYGPAANGFLVRGMGNRLRPAERTTSKEPYVCIYPVLQPSLLAGRQAPEPGMPHLAEVLADDQLLHDLRSGSAALVLDLSNEGFAFRHDTFEVLHDLLQERGVPRNCVIWVSQNRRAPADYYATFGMGIRFAIYDAYVHAALRMAAHSPSSNDPEAYLQLFFERPKTHAFLCLNAEPRPHRVLTIAALGQAGLLDQGLISFLGFAQSKSGAGVMSLAAQDFMSTHPGFAPFQSSFEEALQYSTPPRSVLTGNSLAFVVDEADYLDTFFSIVTETDFSAGEIDRITEKSVKAMAHGHVTHVVGNPGSLALLRELGFITQDDAYDDVLDPVDRFHLLLEAVKRTAEAVNRDPQAWLSAHRDVIEANFRLAVTGIALKTYEDRYIEHLRSTFAEMITPLARPQDSVAVRPSLSYPQGKLP